MFVIKLINRNFLKSFMLPARCISCYSNHLNISSVQSSHLKLIFPPKNPQSIVSNVTYQRRFKYNKSSKNPSEEDDDVNSSEFDDVTEGKDVKVATTRVTSLRMDVIIKSGLGLARNKVENAFYESRIRVNGEKVVKKSLSLHIGDEVDVIKGFSPVNSEHLIVSRIVILSATANEEDVSVTMRKFKTLTIENYSGQNIYKAAMTIN